MLRIYLLFLMYSFIVLLYFFFHNVGKRFPPLPKSANEVKLISSGKILDNNVTVGQCKIPFGDIEEEVITMHVHLLSPLAKSKAGKIHSFYCQCIFLFLACYGLCSPLIWSLIFAFFFSSTENKVGCSCSIMWRLKTTICLEPRPYLFHHGSYNL